MKRRISSGFISVAIGLTFLAAELSRVQQDHTLLKASAKNALVALTSFPERYGM